MGESEGSSEPEGQLPNGLLPGSGSVVRGLDADRWLIAERRTAKLIACIQPSLLSEERRNSVADYVQRLITRCFPCQVCTFGSVPLKTYLPDGDIDLTAFTQNQNLKDTWAKQVQNMLIDEEKNGNAEFHVKEVQYIQAEVKIIKCLVENIVVDISFNQVGGLCTLCFLDEIDNLIRQNHLFKRSIILIKAWCYYESRILGAHHGLISTYALETLVLYIFHVFNSSFHGPLEVLYRFLEFFSKFDWDNYCVSLRGPVPISSLPDITAQPPRKDSGELLLTEFFLDACSSVYAVNLGGHDDSRPFVSKNFNVIDPLRVNNNLGRSVSKSNFFRIRSAFGFGAKRLAKLIDCPKENLISELDQFFMNTWNRHGGGHRPDAPRYDSWPLRLSTSDSPRGFGSSNNDSNPQKVKHNSYAQGMEGEDIRTRDVSNQYDKNASTVTPITTELSSAPYVHSLKRQFNLNSLRVTDQVVTDTLLNDEIQRDPKAGHLVNDTQGRLVFARTRSSPELTDNYNDVSSQVQCDRQAENADAHATYSRLDSRNRRKNHGSESLASHSSHSSVEDTSSMNHVPSQKSLDAADSKSISNSYRGDLGLNASSEEFSATSGAQMMPQEGQDLMNMMASASLQGFNGQVHFPFNLTSGHQPYSIPPSFLASMGYTQRNIPGFLPTNIPLMDPSFSHVQFPHALVEPQLSHYFPGIGLNPSDNSGDKSTENFGLVEMNFREADDDFWQEQDASSSGRYDPEKGNFDTLQSDDKPPDSPSGLKYVPLPSQASRSRNAARVQQNHPREKRGTVLENVGSPPIPRNVEICAEERLTSSRFSSTAHSNSLRSRTSSESSWDESSVKVTNSTKEKKGNIVSTGLTACYGKGKMMPEHMCSDADNDDQKWGSLLNVEMEMVKKSLGPEQVAHLQVPGFNGFEVAQTSGSDSIVPFAPMLIGPGSRQKTTDNSELIAFYPTGPPIPFLAMLPVYNILPETGMSDASSGPFGTDEFLDNSECGMNFSNKGFDQSVELNSSGSLMGISSTEIYDEQKSDILNSDFASHWQNLQFGRFCQNPPYQGPSLYPSPLMLPPYYVQGHAYDNPSRPVSSNTNIFPQLVTSYGHSLVSVAPFQSVSSRLPNIYQSYMDDMPRHRSGTGTYLPNPKVSAREQRHSSGSRRGNYNHDRNDSSSDRDGNWNASKARAAARNHSRSQSDRSNPRTDRFTHNGGRADRLGNSYRHNSIPSYPLQNGSLHSNSSQNSPQNMAYSMYPLAATNPHGVPNGPSVPPAMMMYPFDQNATSHNDQLEFGSLGPVGFQDEQSQLNNGTRARTGEDHRHHGGSVHRSSTDQPASPKPRRRH